MVGSKILGMLVRSLGGGLEGGTEPSTAVDAACLVFAGYSRGRGGLQLPPNADACAFESLRSCHSLDVTWRIWVSLSVLPAHS